MTSRLSLRFLLSLLVAVFLAMASATQTNGMVGGWSAAPVDDARVQQAAEFAFRNTFLMNKDVDTSHITWSLARAQQQVVAGMNYGLTLNVRVGEECQGHYFEVYDRFGDRSITLHKLQACVH